MAKELNKKQAKALALHEDALKHLQAGDAAAGLPLLKEAAALAPTSPNINANLGFAHLALEEFDDALACFKRATALKPNWSLAHYNTGLALYRLRQVPEAKAAYEKALRYKPDDIPATINLALCYLEMLEIEPAMNMLNSVLERDPDNVDATLNIAKVWNLIDRPKQAVGQLKRLADKVHDDVELLVELGAALRKTNDYTLAASTLERALKVDPDNLETKMELARIMLAWRHYKRTIDLLHEIEPDYEPKAAVWQQLGVAYNSIGKLDEGFDYGMRAVEATPENFGVYLNPIFTSNYRVPLDIPAISKLIGMYNREASKKFELIPAYEPPPARPAGEKLRLAFVSPDFREHSCSYFVEGLFGNLDREKFEVIGVPVKSTSDSRTQILKRLTDKWLPIHHLDIAQQVELLREQRIDIAIDLAGHTSDNALVNFAQRVAPVQINWLGYPNTTGVTAMDYRFIDAITDPEDLDRSYYTEKLVRLPGCFLNYSPPASTPVVLDKSQNSQIVFGSFNSIAKVNMMVIETWIEILRRLPSARLIIKSLQLDEDEVASDIFNHLSNAGIDDDRLEVLSPMPSTFDHLNTYNEVDIALDTFPYNGTTTTCEATWMGVPVVTSVGEVHAARVGASLNTALGLPELIASDQEDYVNKAVALASDLPRLRALQAGLRDQMKSSLLCNDALYAEQFGSALEQVWQETMTRSAAGERVASV